MGVGVGVGWEFGKWAQWGWGRGERGTRFAQAQARREAPEHAAVDLEPRIRGLRDTC